MDIWEILKIRNNRLKNKHSMIDELFSYITSMQTHSMNLVNLFLIYKG